MRAVRDGTFVCPADKFFCQIMEFLRVFLRFIKAGDMLQGKGAEEGCRNGCRDFLGQGVSTAHGSFQFRQHAGRADGGRGEIWGSVQYRRS